MIGEMVRSSISKYSSIGIVVDKQEKYYTVYWFQYGDIVAEVEHGLSSAVIKDLIAHYKDWEYDAHRSANRQNGK
jgi:hypothetical protein